VAGAAAAAGGPGQPQWPASTAVGAQRRRGSAGTHGTRPFDDRGKRRPRGAAGHARRPRGCAAATQHDAAGRTAGGNSIQAVVYSAATDAGRRGGGPYVSAGSDNGIASTIAASASRTTCYARNPATGLAR